MKARGQRHRSLDCTVEAIGASGPLRRHLSALLGPPLEIDGSPDIRLVVTGDPPGSRQTVAFAGPDAAWDGRDLWLRQPGGWIRIPGDPLASGALELAAVAGTRELPILRSVLFARAAAAGKLPIHGPAFAIDGIGYVATGWRRSARTGLLLAALASGGSLVCAEHACLDPETRSVAPGVEPIFGRAWHLRELPGTLPTRRRPRLREMLVGRGLDVVRRLPLDRARAIETRGGRMAIQLGAGDVPAAGVKTPIAAIVVLTATTDRTISIGPLSAPDAAARLAALFDGEVANLVAVQAQQGYFRGEDGPAPVHALVNDYRELAERVVADLPAFDLRHGPEPPLGRLIATLRSAHRATSDA